MVFLFNGVSMKIPEFLTSVKKLSSDQLDIINSFFLLVDQEPDVFKRIAIFEKYLNANNKSFKSLSKYLSYLK